MNNVLLIMFSILNAAGVFFYMWLSIILMEVVLCKDAKQVNRTKLFSRKLGARLRLLKRSLGSNFYRASFCIWIGSYIVIFIRLTELSGHIVPATNSPRAIASMLIPYGIILLYRYMGYESTLFTPSNKEIIN